MRVSAVAMLVGLGIGALGCQRTESEITLENRTTADVILMVQGGVDAPFYLPACGRVVFDPDAPRPTGVDPSVAHPDAVVLPYYLGLVADDATIATIDVTSQGIFRGFGRPASSPACAGRPPVVSPLPSQSPIASA
jgi:hypothetical protein